jgi:predicted dehydrogenase
VKRIKIHGAGSIGNHQAHAARTLGWDVTVCDTDPAALRRMQSELYPSRYGAWDPAIALTPSSDAPKGGFDLVIIGTPPDSHVPLAIDAMTEQPKAILIEKPLCDPSPGSVERVAQLAAERSARVFVGYDHVVGRAAREVAGLIASGILGTVVTIDVEFREHWAGIFHAHPWLSGPDSSYLGHWQRGGGASGEHSHALNLWQYFAHLTGAGRISTVDAMLDYVREGSGTYDRLCLLHLRTEAGLIGRTVQDVVTLPSRKWARIQGTNAAIEWILGLEPGVDAVIVRRRGEPEQVTRISKTRPDDFIEELRHVERHVADGTPSPIDLMHGVDTMRAVAAAHESEREGRRVVVNYGPAQAAAVTGPQGAR